MSKSTSGQPANHARGLSQSELTPHLGGVYGAALAFAGGTLLSRILGLFRDMLIARYFSSDVRDAFLNAFRLPNLFRRVFGDGAMGASFIPVFVATLSGRGPKDQQVRELVAGVLAVLLVATSSLSLLAIIFMPDVLHLLLNGVTYMSIPGKFALTVLLARIMFSFLILVSCSAFFMALLNGVGQFGLSALAPVVFNIALVSGALLSPRFSFPEGVLAIAVLLGGGLQMLVLMPAVVRAGLFPNPAFVRWSPEVSRVFKLFLPSAISLSVLQLSSLISMRFAADLRSGSHSFLYLADRVLELPVSLVGVSLGTALLPTLSGFWHRGDQQQMASAVNHALRMTFFISIPAALGLVILADPITQLLFMGREFSYDNAVQTAAVLRIESALVVLTIAVRILSQGFYASHRSWFPAIATVVALIAHLLFAIVLTPSFGLKGLAAAAVTGVFVNALLLGVVFHARIAVIELRSLGVFAAKVGISSLALTAALFLHHALYRALLGKVPGARTISLAGIIFFAAGIYFAVSAILRMEEFGFLLKAVKTRITPRS